ncbi:hydrolase [Pseudenhygromyxa sp. WMMC2535]|uniref:M57 family metalloprotease n=1 Tax=Pseudenhygromyxa sp. WMMC2535 TaxID=2712867 RepID=UPI001551F409|nr:M57 family metalloprotease [Pseudenhygromyxa sp. WMMC2535]NVB40612.1 hydrolase [Pseudenhygromyxa sp. WMMC2535]
MLKKSLGCAGSLFVIAALSVGCAAEDGEDTIPDAKLHSEQDIITDYLIEAGYPESEIEIDAEGRVLVGRDAVVTMQAAREIAGHIDDFGSEEDDFRQYRTTNMVSPDVATICITTDSTFDNNAASAALDLAIQRYNELGMSFTMVRNGNNCDATIDANIDNSGGGVSGFPANGLPYHEFYIGKDVTGNYGTAVGPHVIEHELGHCLGFRHTDYYDRSISCGGAKTNEGASDVGAEHITGTPTNAVINGSVMNSCYNTSSDGVWTDSDEVAWTCMYVTGDCAPPPPATYDVNVETLTGLAGGGKNNSYGPFSADGLSAMRFATNANNGDADLYVGQGYVPSSNNYDCASAGATSVESCEANPASGDYYVTIKAWSSFNNLTLTVDGAY